MTETTPSGEPFEGKIGRTIADSEPWWPAPRLKAGAPNVVLVVLDDTGFAHLGCYGSTIETPEHRRAGRRRRCASPASTPPRSARRPAPACSPGATTTPSACGRSPTSTPAFRTCAAPCRQSAATLAEILRDNGYATFAAGKWHLAPMAECTAAGPVHQLAAAEGLRPLLRLPAGRDRPVLPRADLRQPLRRPAGAPPEDGYHVSEDIVDRSIGMDPRPDLAGARAAVLPLPGLRRDALAAPGAAEPTCEKYRGRVRRRLGRGARALVRAAEGDGHRPGGHAAGAAQSRRAAVDRAQRQRAARSPRGCRRPSRPCSTTPTPRSAG